MSIPFIIGAIAEQAGPAISPPVPASGFATGPDYRTNWLGLTTATSAISQQGNAVRLQAGPTLGNLDAEHCQIVSKVRHPASFILTVDITVRDTTTGTAQIEAGLIYMAMWGDTVNGYDSDLTKWSGIDGSTRFEKNAFGYRCSFNGRDPTNVNSDQVRLRQANATGSVSDLIQIIGGGTPNTQPGSWPFVKDKTYRVKITKQAQSWKWSYQNMTDGGAVLELPIQSSDLLDDYKVGQFVFRVMAGRTMDFNVISVEDITSTDPVDPNPVDPDGTGELPPATLAKTLQVTTASAFQAALNDATHMDGWTVIAAPPAGTTWSDDFTINKIVDPSKQSCVFRCENEGDVNLSGSIVFADNSSGIILWGFKRQGRNVFTKFAGIKNSIRRSDVSGWGSRLNNNGKPGPGWISHIIGVGRDCSIWYCSFHDPAGWLDIEYANAAGAPTSLGGTPGSMYPLRMSVRGTVTGTGDWMTGFHLYGNVFYKIQAKVYPAVYGSSQQDAFEACETVDDMAGYKPARLYNWLCEKNLVEDTHLQSCYPDGSISQGGEPAAGAASWDLKGGGITVKKLTMLCRGRIDWRNNAGNTLQDSWIESVGVYFQGGGPTTVPSNYPDYPINAMDNVVFNNGKWGVPNLNIVNGNALPNQRQSLMSPKPSKMAHQVKNGVLQNLWGSANIKVGYDDFSGCNLYPDGVVIKDFQDGIKVNLLNQTNTTVSKGTGPVAGKVKPTKLTRGECGVTATFVTPEY